MDRLDTFAADSKSDRLLEQKVTTRKNMKDCERLRDEDELIRILETRLEVA